MSATDVGGVEKALLMRVVALFLTMLRVTWFTQVMREDGKRDRRRKPRFPERCEVFSPPRGERTCDKVE